jgi:two-component system, NarL family, response regulator
MAAGSPIRLLVADDHTLIRRGLRDMIGTGQGMAIVAEAARGDDAVALYREHRPDVALLDLRMPGTSGDEAMAQIRAEFPDARMIALTHCQGEEDMQRAVAAGARAYLVKTVLAEELVETIRAVHAGQWRLAKAVTERLDEARERPALTPKELEVLELIARGHGTESITAALGITAETARVHIKRILGKLEVSSRSAAVAAAVQRGIVHLD